MKNIILPARSLGHLFIWNAVDKSLNEANARVLDHPVINRPTPKDREINHTENFYVEIIITQTLHIKSDLTKIFDVEIPQPDFDVEIDSTQILYAESVELIFFPLKAPFAGNLTFVVRFQMDAFLATKRQKGP